MARVVVVGAGNIGTHVLPHVARLSHVSAITVIDRDQYEASNVSTQNIYAADVGTSKALVQARRLKAINAALESRGVHAAVEEMPLGWLRADVILSCVDTRRGRMVLNQAAFRLRVPWIDAGIDASGLARVHVYEPSDEASCLECAWDGRDYELVEQDYPCDNAPAPRTGASSALGGVAAALQALECEKLLSADTTHSLAGRDVLLDARHHRHYVTRFDRNRACRMPDHAGWTIGRCTVDLCSTTVRDLIGIVRPDAHHDVRLEVAGQQFALALTCLACGERHAALHLHRGTRRRTPGRCRSCGGSLVAAGFDLRDRVSLADVPADMASGALADLGMLCGDVVTLTAGETDVHVELCEPQWPIEF